MRNVKRRALCLGIILFLLAGLSAYAHNGDYQGGVYIQSNIPKNTLVVIKESARTSLLTAALYDSVARDWNGISSNVNVTGVVTHYNAMPSFPYDINVRGEVMPLYVGGETVGYDYNGNPVPASWDWYASSIIMNIAQGALSSAEQAKRTFVHELGHVFKLAHPLYGAAGHNGSYPYAIMNQSDNTPYAASSIQAHDRDNLKAKWGA